MRRMSLSVAGMLQAGHSPAAEASIVKDLGTNFEQALPNKVRLMAPVRGDSCPRQQRRPLRGGPQLHHADRPQADDPGRHPRDPARHHRPRVGAAVMLSRRSSERCASLETRLQAAPQPDATLSRHAGEDARRISDEEGEQLPCSIDAGASMPDHPPPAVPEKPRRSSARRPTSRSAERSHQAADRPRLRRADLPR